jgi:sulfite oxidase
LNFTPKNSYNAQPESPEPIWNLRGLNNNSWHRVHCVLQKDEDGNEEEAEE